MNFHLIVNHVIRAPRNSLISIASCSLFFLFLSIAPAVANISPEKFSSAVSGLHSPQIEISHASLPAESNLLNERISRLKHSGFGSVLLTSVPFGSNSWDHIIGVAESCRQHSMKLGCDFFPQVEKPTLLYRIVSTNHVINAEMQADKIKLPVLSGDERLITKFLMPAAYSNDIQRAFFSGQTISSNVKQWVEYNYIATPFTPSTINYLDRALFESSVNKFLLNAQIRLANNYGTVFGMVRFPALSKHELVWFDNLPGWFFESVSFDLVRNIPVLAWEDNVDTPFVKDAHERYQRGIKRLWRENFAKRVPSLVHEAGLNTAISVQQMGLQPEEYVDCFKFPLASGSTSVVQRTLNCRTTGGARVYECSRLMGVVGAHNSNLGSVIDALFIDGVNSLLFAEDIIDFSSNSQFDSLSTLCSYVNRCSYVLQNAEPAQGILLCSEEIPPTMNHFVFDSVTPSMLKEAETRKGRVVFISGRSSSTVVFSDDILKSNQSLVDQLRKSGVLVMSLQDITKLAPDLSWNSDVKDLKLRFVRRSGLKREYFMIKNESDVGAMVDLDFKVNNFSRVSRWQPQDGRIFEISKFWKSSPAHSSLSMLVRPGELFFVVFEL